MAVKLHGPDRDELCGWLRNLAWFFAGAGTALLALALYARFLTTKGGA